MPKKFRLLNNHVASVLEAASAATESTASAEICGLLIDNGYFIELIKVRNKSKGWGSFSFYVNEINLLEKAVRLMGHEIIGTFHSHPYGTSSPSKSDILNTNDDSYMLIIDVTRSELGLWYIKDSDKTQIEFELI
jgi:proteasome lid subunit RPN8/RPN11